MGGVRWKVEGTKRDERGLADQMLGFVVIKSLVFREADLVWSVNEQNESIERFRLVSATDFPGFALTHQLSHSALFDLLSVSTTLRIA